MAAFVTLTDGTYTFMVTNSAGGGNYGDNFFKPGIRSLTNPKLSGDDYARLRDCTLKIDYSIKDTTNAVTINDVWSTKVKRQLDCSIVLYDGTTAITYTNLKAVRFGRGQTYTYQVVSEKITDDLLTAAPDVKATSGDATTYNDNRYYPRVFGTVKHVNPLLLVRDTLTYYSGGELVECYSRGQTQTVTKATDKTFTADRAIIDPFTMDVKHGSQTSETLTGVVAKGAYLYPGEEVGTPNDAGLYFAKDRFGYYNGAAWAAYVQNNGNFYFGGDDEHYISWNGSNLLTNGIQMTANGTSGTPSTTPGTATRLTIVGGTAPSSGLTTYTRLDFTPTEDGQTHFYTWNTSTNTGWNETAVIGIDTVGSDSYIFRAYSNTAYRVCFRADSSSNASCFEAINTGTGAAFYGVGNSASAGIRGVNNAGGNAVHGSATAGNGVYGTGPTAVYGETTSSVGIGVRGNGNANGAIGGKFEGSASAIYLVPQDGTALTGTPQDGYMVENTNAAFGTGAGLYIRRGGAWVKLG